MRIAVVSDVHGNLTALEAVIADLAQASPDLIVHGGDLATHGYRPAEVVDRIRDLAWPGVHGNTDEMLWAPEQREPVLARAPKLSRLIGWLFDVLAPETRARLGSERIEFLRRFPGLWSSDNLTVVHASPDNLWKAPMPDAGSEELVSTYGSLQSPLVVYGHIHRAYITRTDGGFIVANTGSVGLPFDEDPRASYLLIDDGRPSTRRVEYDIDKECAGLLSSNYPGAEWLAGTLKTGRQAPPPV